MKGVVLAGGTGSRLLPLTKVTNKHLLPVGRVPMIFHPIQKFVGAGISEILVVTGTEHMGDLVGTLGSGRDLGCDLTYRVQDRAGGIAEALGLSRGFASGEKICVILGDNIFEDDIRRHVAHFAEADEGAMVLLKRVEDPERFGVAELDTKTGRILSIEEKPERPKSNCAIVGVYFYGPGVFDVIAGLKPSVRGELEISDVNRHYLERDDLAHGELRGWWTDAGTHESLTRANDLARAEAWDRQIEADAAAGKFDQFATER